MANITPKMRYILYVNRSRTAMEEAFTTAHDLGLIAMRAARLADNETAIREAATNLSRIRTAWAAYIDPAVVTIDTPDY